MFIFTDPGVVKLYEIASDIVFDDKYNSPADAAGSDDYSIGPLDGYFYVDTFDDTTCSLTPVYSFGYRLKQCVVVYDQDMHPISSTYGSCSSDTFTLSSFDSTDCSGTPSNSTFSNLNSCFSSDGGSLIGLCSTGDTIPVHMDSVLVRYETNHAWCNVHV